jgi:hypothetical protein
MAIEDHPWEDVEKVGIMARKILANLVVNWM